MNKALIFALLSLLSLQSFAQTPEEIIEKFFEEYESKGANEALDNLYVTNKWINKSQDAIKNLKSQLSNIESLVGEYYGYEFITKKTAGESLRLYSYLIRYDRQPIRFTFEFYKPRDEWIVFGFAYDENVDDELEEAAKVYRLPENY